MSEERYIMYCEQQPPSKLPPDIIERKEPATPRSPPAPCPPPDPSKKMIDPPKGPRSADCSVSCEARDHCVEYPETKLPAIDSSLHPTPPFRALSGSRK